MLFAVEKRIKDIHSCRAIHWLVHYGGKSLQCCSLTPRQREPPQLRAAVYSFSSSVHRWSWRCYRLCLWSFFLRVSPYWEMIWKDTLTTKMSHENHPMNCSSQRVIREGFYKWFFNAIYKCQLREMFLRFLPKHYILLVDSIDRSKRKIAFQVAANIRFLCVDRVKAHWVECLVFVWAGTHSVEE